MSSSDVSSLFSRLRAAAGFDVVAYGTGYVNTRESVSSTGRIVHDSHAVVAARRSLMRLVNVNLNFLEKKKTKQGLMRFDVLCCQVSVSPPADVFQPNG